MSIGNRTNPQKNSVGIYVGIGGSFRIENVF